jgi:hypothetical protein
MVYIYMRWSRDRRWLEKSRDVATMSCEAFYLYLYEWTQWLGTGLREDLQSVHVSDKTATSWIETRSRE